MSWENDYDTAVRIQFVDLRKDSQNRPVYSLMPFQLVNIAGSTYIEPMYEPTHGKGILGNPFLPFHNLQTCEDTVPQTYNPSGLPLFMKQRGV